VNLWLAKHTESAPQLYPFSQTRMTRAKD